MSVNVRCPNPTCGLVFAIPEAYVGKSGRCSKCKQTFTLTPEGSEPAAKGGEERIGRFVVRGKLGAGAFGTVYRAWDPQLEREVALKVPVAAVLDSPKRVERFLREAKAAAGLRHPHIVPVYDAGEDGDTRYIASAFIEGKPLSSALDEKKGVDPQRAARIVRALAEAVFYAHSLNVVHRDIKPANVMLDAEDRPHLMDFGLASRLESVEKLTQEGAVMGTPAYMAPEQAAGQQGEAKPESDQYALGVVLYELVTGRTPFEGPPQVVIYNLLHEEPPAPRKLRKDIPRDLETICLKAMAREPDRRYADCQALADDLGRWLEGEPIRARRMGLVERFVRWMKREPKLALASGLTAASLLALVTAVGIWGMRHYSGLFTTEQAAHAGTKARLGEVEGEKEKALADLEKEKQEGDRARDGVEAGHLMLAQARLQADDPTEAFRSLQRCAVRTFPWHQLRLQTEGTGQAVRVLRRDGWGGVARVAFSKDSRRLVGVGRDNSVVSWHLGLGKVMGTRPLAKHDGGGAMVQTMSADGRIVAAVMHPGGGGGPRPVPAAAEGPHFTALQGEKPPERKPPTLVVWDATTGEKVFTAEAPTGDNASVTLSPAGDRVVVVTMSWGPMGQTSSMRAWDVPGKKQLPNAKAELKHVRFPVSVSDDGKTLLVLSGDHSMPPVATFIDLDTGEELPSLEGLPEGVMNINYVPGSKYVVTSGGGMMPATECVAVTEKRVRDKKLPDGTIVKEEYETTTFKTFTKMVGGGAARFQLWTPGEKQPVVTLEACGQSTGYGQGDTTAVSPDGKVLARVCVGGCKPGAFVQLNDLPSGRLLLALPVPEGMNLNQLLFSPDGRHLAGLEAYGSGRVALWTIDGGRLLHQYDGHPGAVTDLLFSPDGTLVSSYSACTQSSAVWAPRTGKELIVQKGGGMHAGYGHGGGSALAFTPDGECVFSGKPRPGGCYGIGSMGPPTVWDRGTGQPIEWPKDVSVLAASPDGKRLVTAPPPPKFEPGKPPPPIDPATMKVSVRDVAGKELYPLEGVQPYGAMVRFTEDGKRLVVMRFGGPGGGGLFELRDAANGKVLVKHEGGTGTAVFSPDGKTVASAAARPFIAPVPRKVPDDAHAVDQFIAFQPPGVIVPGPGGPPPARGPLVVKLFNLADGKELKSFTFPGNADAIGRLYFTPSGKRLIAASGSPWEKPRSVVVWDAASGKVMLESACDGEPRLSPTGRYLAVPVGSRTAEPPMGAPVARGPASEEVFVSAESDDPSLVFGRRAGPAKGAEVKLFDLEAGGQRTIPAAGEEIGGIAFSADGALFAVVGGSTPGPNTPLKAGEVVVRDTASGKELITFRGHSGIVNCAAFSPDGSLLATGGWDGAVKVWRLSTTQEVGGVTWDAARPTVVRKTLGDAKLRHWMGVASVAFSPDGKHVASGGDDNQALLHDAATGERVRAFVGHQGHVRGVAFRPDGRWLATAGWDDSVRLWEVETGKELRVLRPHFPAAPVAPGVPTPHHRSAGHVWCVAFSDDGKTIAAGTAQGKAIFLWEAETGNLIRAFEAHRTGIVSIAFAPGGKLLASGAQDGAVKLWEVPSGKELKALDAHKGDAYAVIFAGTELVTGGVDGLVRFWSTDDGKELRKIEPKGGVVFSLAVRPDGKELAVGLQNGEIRTFSLPDGKPVRTFSKHDHDVRGVAYDRDGKRLASGAQDRVVRLWNVADGKELLPPAGHVGQVAAVAVSPDGKTLASGGWDGKIILSHPDSGEQVTLTKGPGPMIRGLAFGPDGKDLFSAGEDGRVRVWNAPGRKERKVLVEPGSGQARCLAVSPDGKRVAVGSVVNSTIRVWDVEAGKVVATLTGHKGEPWGVVWLDDETLVSTSHDATVKVWDVAAQKEKQTLKQGEPSHGWALAVHGGRVAVAHQHALARIWDVTRGELLKELRTHDASVHGVRFRGDGKVLATGDHRGRVKLWHADLGVELESVALGPTHSVLSALAFFPGGRRLVTGNGDGTLSILDLPAGE